MKTDYIYVSVGPSNKMDAVLEAIIARKEAFVSYDVVFSLIDTIDSTLKESFLQKLPSGWENERSKRRIRCVLPHCSSVRRQKREHNSFVCRNCGVGGFCEKHRTIMGRCHNHGKGKYRWKKAMHTETFVRFVKDYR